MNLIHHVSLEFTLLKWLILVTLALALVLIATQTTAADTSVPSTPWTSEVSEASEEEIPTPRIVWGILEDHQQGFHERAIDGWNQLLVDENSECWRVIAIGSAHEQLGRIEEAAKVLRRLSEDSPAAAVREHLLGVIALMRICLDERQPTTSDLSNYEFSELPTHSDFQDSALLHFEQAIAEAARLDRDALLCPPTTRLCALDKGTIFPNRMLPPRQPTVGDLLTTLQLDDYVVTSHLARTHVFISQTSLRLAEVELDAACQLDPSAAALFKQLGDEYSAQDMHHDSARAYLKAIPGTRNKTSSLLRAIQEIRKQHKEQP